MQGVDECSVGAADSPQSEPYDVETCYASEVDEASNVPSTSCDTEDASGQTSSPEPQQSSDEPVDSDQVGSLVLHMAEQLERRQNEGQQDSQTETERVQGACCRHGRFDIDE